MHVKTKHESAKKPFQKPTKEEVFVRILKKQNVLSTIGCRGTTQCQQCFYYYYYVLEVNGIHTYVMSIVK